MAVQAFRRGEARVIADVLGRRVRARRGDLAYSQLDLARAMQALGHKWSAATVSRVETGVAEPCLSELISLLFALRTSFQELTDPVLAGDEPVEIGVPFPGGTTEWLASDVRELLKGDLPVQYPVIKERGESISFPIWIKKRGPQQFEIEQGEE